jgi:hypothetical protein
MVAMRTRLELQEPERSRKRGDPWLGKEELRRRRKPLMKKAKDEKCPNCRKARHRYPCAAVVEGGGGLQLNRTSPC